MMLFLFDELLSFNTFFDEQEGKLSEKLRNKASVRAELLKCDEAIKTQDAFKIIDANIPAISTKVVKEIVENQIVDTSSANLKGLRLFFRQV